MSRGAKPGERRGGRQKGSKNRSTLEHIARANEAAKEGITPLELMLNNMRRLDAEAYAVDEKTGLTMVNEEKAMQSVEIAKAAAQYVHPKLNSIEANPENPLKLGLDINSEDVMIEAARRMAFMVMRGAIAEAKRTSSGRKLVTVNQVQDQKKTRSIG